eukprot:scaffold131109_cov69-Phaeocystis_antarctica.AAC.1
MSSSSGSRVVHVHASEKLVLCSGAELVFTQRNEPRLRASSPSLAPQPYPQAPPPCPLPLRPWRFRCIPRRIAARPSP